MKEYKLDELIILRDELIKSMNPEQKILMDALMTAVVKNVNEIRDKSAEEIVKANDIAQESLLKSRTVIDGLQGDFNKLQGAFDLMIQKLKDLGIDFVPS